MPPKTTTPACCPRSCGSSRNPTTNWADLDQQETDRESRYSKQMLKEMIERKRRNDFVRKREFDMLRKMRRSEVMAGQDPAARPSFFQSSMPSKPDDRATTLKKIDEIEAQMSMQWWKTKHGDRSTRLRQQHRLRRCRRTCRPRRCAVPASPPRKSTAYTRTEPQPLPRGARRRRRRSDRADARRSRRDAPRRRDRPATAWPHAAPLGCAHARRCAVPPPAPPPPGAARSRWPRPSPASQAPVPSRAAPSAFSASKLFAIDVDEFAHDPELEEAAIRFANGDDAGAEAGLMEVLAPERPARRTTTRPG